MEYDPTKVGVDQLLEAVKQAGYKPRRDGPVAASATQAGTKLEAATKEASLSPGKGGRLTVKLTAPKGQEASELSVEASGGEGLTVAEAKVEAKAGAREVEVPVTVKAGTKAGALKATLTIRWKQAGGAQEVRLEVPVYVE